MTYFWLHRFTSVVGRRLPTDRTPMSSWRLWPIMTQELADSPSFRLGRRERHQPIQSWQLRRQDLAIQLGELYRQAFLSLFEVCDRFSELYRQ